MCENGFPETRAQRKQALDNWSRRERYAKHKRIIMKRLGGAKCRYCDSTIELQFHHPKRQKEDSITNMITNFGLEKVWQEAKKCIVLCRKCHDKETAKQFAHDAWMRKILE